MGHVVPLEHVVERSGRPAPRLDPDGHDGALPIDQELDLLLRVGRESAANRDALRGERARDEAFVQAAFHRSSQRVVHHRRLEGIIVHGKQQTGVVWKSCCHIESVVNE